MAHIELTEGLPGIRGLFNFSPKTAEPMSQLAQVLLHDAASLTQAERELIATYVSSLNDCSYCQTSHGAIAAHHLGGDEATVAAVTHDFKSAPVSDKLKALLVIAGKVQKGGKNVLAEDVAQASSQGASDQEIHDTVLIAAAFCMFNRYVDGLATWTPTDHEGYRTRAAFVAVNGYNGILSYVQATKEREAAKSVLMRGSGN